MSDDVIAILPALQALYAEERAEITYRLWQSLPNIRVELFEHYDQEFHESIVDRIDHVRLHQPVRFTTNGAELCERALALSAEDRGDVTHNLWQALPSMYGLFGEDDPKFVAEINRRIANAESGQFPGVPHDVFMARMKAKYG